LIATIYIANNDSQKAYQHILNFAKLCDYPISIYNFQNILPYFNGSLQEVIDILQYRAKAAPEGQKRDSYFETIQNLEKREAKLLNQE
ncbi:MAG TPA: hypothetical protein PLR57_00525, partial [Clostridia bacterium]|nr:hypothetical protein [Clostridia bacterium]